MEYCKRCGRELKYRTFGDGYCKTCGVIVNKETLPFRVKARLKKARRLRGKEYQKNNRARINALCRISRRLHPERYEKEKERMRAYSRLGLHKKNPETFKKYRNSPRGKVIRRLNQAKIYWKHKEMKENE